MNDLDTALRDALSARAAAVTHDPAAYDAVVARRARRTARTWFAVVAAGAVAATLVGVVTLQGDRPLPEPPASPAVTGPPAPERLTGLLAGKALIRESDEVGDDHQAMSIGSYLMTAATALGDGTTFYSAGALRAGCRSTFQHYTATPGRTVAKGVPGGDVDGRVVELAVSPDGRRLAYVAESARTGGEGCTATELRVRDLRTGTERVWTDGLAPGTRAMGGTFVRWLSWDAASRRLAYSADVCCLGARGFRVLDTDAPGTSFLDSPAHGETLGSDESCALVAPAYRGTTGELTAVRACASPDGIRAPSAVVVVDPATGDVLRELVSLPGEDGVQRVDFDSTGTHALIERGAGDVTTRVQRWDGTTLRDIDFGRHRVRQVSW